MLDVLFQHVFTQFGSLFASCGHACWCVFVIPRFVRHLPVTERVHEWTVVGDARTVFGPTVLLCCVCACVTRNISNGLVCVPHVHRFPEHMVSMFSFGLNDNSLHSAKRRLLSREAWINKAYIVADGQIAASPLAEVVVHIPIFIVIVFPRVRRDVTTFVSLRPMVGSDVGEKDCGADEGWFVFALRSSVMVDLECWTVIAIVHRKCYRVDVLGVQCLHPFCAVFKFMWSALHSPADVEWLLKSHNGVLSTFCAESDREMFVLLGVGNSSAWFEGFSIIQRIQCWIMAKQVVSRKRRWCTWAGVVIERWLRICLSFDSFSFTVLRENLCWFFLIMMHQVCFKPDSMGFVLGRWFWWCLPTNGVAVMFNITDVLTDEPQFVFDLCLDNHTVMHWCWTDQFMVCFEIFGVMGFRIQCAFRNRSSVCWVGRCESAVNSWSTTLCGCGVLVF